MRYLSAAVWLVLGLTLGCGHKTAVADHQASLEDLNRALTVVAMHSGYAPPPTNEVVKFLALTGKSMPMPPPGKKLVLDPVQRQFVWADQ